MNAFRLRNGISTAWQGISALIMKPRWCGYTRTYNTTERVLRRKADPVLGQSCTFLNPVTRQCKIYNARPAVCREFPTTDRCAHFDLLEFERTQQDDPDVLPLIQITFRNGNGR